MQQMQRQNRALNESVSELKAQLARRRQAPAKGVTNRRVEYLSGAAKDAGDVPRALHVGGGVGTLVIHAEGGTVNIHVDGEASSSAAAPARSAAPSFGRFVVPTQIGVDALPKRTKTRRLAPTPERTPQARGVAERAAPEAPRPTKAKAKRRSDAPAPTPAQTKRQKPKPKPKKQKAEKPKATAPKAEQPPAPAAAPAGGTEA
jgi:hypothetical protein